MFQNKTVAPLNRYDMQTGVPHGI